MQLLTSTKSIPANHPCFGMCRRELLPRDWKHTTSSRGQRTHPTSTVTGRADALGQRSTQQRKGDVASQSGCQGSEGNGSRVNIEGSTGNSSATSHTSTGGIQSNVTVAVNNRTIGRLWVATTSVEPHMSTMPLVMKAASVMVKVPATESQSSQNNRGSTDRRDCPCIY